MTDCDEIKINKVYYSNSIIKRIEHYQGGQLHRLDGPAMEEFRPDGTVRRRGWYQNDKPHRLNGPAEEWLYLDGTPEYRDWCQNGKLHRLDGPAVEEYCNNGSVKSTAYYINGEQLSEPNYRRRMALLKLSTRVAQETGVSL